MWNININDVPLWIKWNSKLYESRYEIYKNDNEYDTIYNIEYFKMTPEINSVFDFEIIFNIMVE